MNFHELSLYLQKLEGTTSRNSIIEILAELYKETSKAEIGQVTYLLQGRVVPVYTDLEFGMADKMVIKAIAKAYDEPEEEIRGEYKKVGDLGILAEKKTAEHKGKDSISIDHVFKTLKKIAETSGEGSVEKKIDLLVGLFQSADSLSARYIARIPVGNLRLGFSDMTVLDALSWSISGTKEHRKELEAAYNVRPDLGLIAEAVKEQGIKGVAHIKPAVFNPILMARAERLSSGQEIIEKIGKCGLEPKFDGFRLQAHVQKRKTKSEKGKAFEVKLFTRGLEDVTFMYPDVVEGIEKQLDVDEAIIEGEALAYDRETDAFLPFQITTQRKRKYGISEMAEKYPLRLMCFELLYLDGKPTLYEPYEERRKKLSKIIKTGSGAAAAIF
jgi:DNA ligase-1